MFPFQLKRYVVICMILVNVCGLVAHDRLTQLLEHLYEHPNDVVYEAFFIPEDKIQPLLLELINSEQRSIWAACYNFTEPEVAEALMAAYDRGVDVQLIADVEGLRPKAEKITMLYDYGIPVYLYARYRSLMHNKYIIFTDTINGNSILWTGSANITKAGLNSNEENVIITNDAHLVTRYQEGFAATKERMRKAKEKKLFLRPGCSYVSNRLVVQVGRIMRAFRIR